MNTWLSPGEVLITKSGMTTTPVPIWKALDTDRKILNANRKISAWIKQNAIREAEYRGHHHLVFIWSKEKDRMPESVRNDMADYLFHWDLSAIPMDTTMDFLKPFYPPNREIDRKPPSACSDGERPIPDGEP